MSVVIATRDRPDHLRALLAGLREQTLSREAFEVIVVDDGSSASSTQAVLAESSADGELLIRIVRHDAPVGPAAARNSGWRQAAASLVAFTDDDCVPSPEWLARALDVAAANPGAIVQGRTEPVREQLGLFERSITVRRLGPQYQTCNICYPRDLLERLGGFDETFGLVMAGEDTDLAWRGLELGIPAVFASDAIVFHAVHDLGPLGVLREPARWRQAPRVFREHPGARAILSRGVFWNGWHYLVLRSLIALWLPARMRQFLLTRHLLQLGKRAREHGVGPWAIPFLLLYDVLEITAVVRGSIRYRTFVL